MRVWARLHGIELTGRVRAAPHVAFHYSYDVQSVVLNDLPTAVLETNPTLVNGLQVFEIPEQNATLGIDVRTRSGIEARLDGHFVASNNPQQLPGYMYAGASLGQAVSKRCSLLFAISNAFNSHAQAYGLVGSAPAYATNLSNTAIGTPFLQPFNERCGLAPTTFTLTATATF